MGRNRAPTHNIVRKAGNEKVARKSILKNSALRSAFAAPPCFISALALSMMVGGGAAAADPGGACNATASNLTCTGTVTNPSAFTPNSDFTVNIGTTTPTDSPAYITQGSGFAGIKVNAGDFGGTISMTTGSTISVEAGPGTSRNGMVIASYGEGATRTYTLDLDGSITSNASDGDALRLEGSSSVVFDATIGRNGHLGGGTGDDAVIVTGAQSLLLNNYGVLEGGSAHPSSGGEGINIGNANSAGERIAAEGVTINNHGTITGTGNSGIGGGQGIIVYGAGDVTIANSRRGEISGASQGIRIEADGIVSITNDGHIQGNSKAGIEIADASAANVTNRSRHTISGATDGVDIHDVDSADLNNDRGHIIGHDGDGARIDNVDGNVTVQNRFGSRWNAATIEGSDSGLAITDVGGNIAVDNRFGGKIIGHDDDGIRIRDADRSVVIDNSHAGTVLGHDDGIHVSDVHRDVAIDNSFGGQIAGWRDDGVDVSDVRGDVKISNAFDGSISGRDNGVQVRDVRDDLTIANVFGGTITGRNGNGIDVDRVRDDVAIYNAAGDIIGGDTGIAISNIGDDVKVENILGGKIAGQERDGIYADDIGGDVEIGNALGGSISGHEDGIQVSNVRHDVTIDNSSGGNITGWRDDGIDVSDVRGDVNVSNAVDGSISGRDNGLQIRNVRDDLTIANAFGGTIAGRNGNGIEIDRVRDDVAIYNAAGDITGGDTGIAMSNIGDDVKIENLFGGKIAGADGDGIRVEDIDGDIEIANALRGRVSGHDDGIHIRGADDDVSISNGFGSRIIGWRDDGIDVRDVRDDVRIDNRFGSSIVGNDSGVKVEDVGGDAVISNVASSISGEHGSGLDVSHVDGDVALHNWGGEITGREDGIRVRDVEQDIEVHNNLGGTITGSRGDGIDVRDVEGDVRISNAFGGKIRGADNGIQVEGADNDVRIDNRFGGSITGHDDGIKIRNADEDVTVKNNYGTIHGHRDAGLDIEAGGSVAVDNGAGTIRGRTNAIAIEAKTAEINSSGLIQGSGRFSPVIALSTESGATINNGEGGLIRGFRSAPEDLAVEAEGGSVTIDNAGTIIGRVDLSDAGSTGSPNTFNNTSNNSWHFVGTSDLGNGLADAFNNTGTVYTTDPNDPSKNDMTILAGVEYFNNGGISGTGTINLQDGYTGDVFSLSPSGGGSLVFNGAPGKSILKVDSFLGTASRSSSDTLAIDGNVTGATAIQVNNVNAGFGSFNPVGIDVVTATGSLPANSFYLAGGAINTGMFTYDLYRKGPDEWVLASAPNHAFFELPSLTSAAQSIWHSAAGGWLDRTADLRAAIGNTCDVGSLKDPSAGCSKPTSGAWAKVLGSSESRSTDHSFTVLNTRKTSAVDTQLDGGGVIGGYDLIRSTDDGSGIWMVGVMGGYLRSTLDFDTSTTGAKFEAGAVGGYLTYLRGGWFLDGQVLANIGDVKYSGSFSEKDQANFTSIGGVLDTGYRMAYGGTFIEPGATLSYVNSGIDDLALYGTAVNFTSGDSLRGRIGVRLGTTIVNERAKYEPFIGISGLYEFLGDNKADVSSGGYVLQAADNLTGALGEVSGGINVFSLAGDGLTAFAKGDVQFGKDDFVGYGGTLGVRVDW